MKSNGVLIRNIKAAATEPPKESSVRLGRFLSCSHRSAS
jgi:hypothetical protein